MFPCDYRGNKVSFCHRELRERVSIQNEEMCSTWCLEKGETMAGHELGKEFLKEDIK